MPCLEPNAGRVAPFVARVLFVVAVAGPALALGGVHPWTVTAMLVVVTLAWLLICRPTRGRLVVPAWVAIGLVAAAVTFVQWLPLPELRSIVAPRLDEIVQGSLRGLSVDARPGLTPVPADTGLEVARLLGLSILFVIASMLRWRMVAAVVAITGTAVALVGFAHEALAIERIYGVYEARDVDLAAATALRGPFVNANHQSGLLLLGIFASAALAVDHSRKSGGPAEGARVDRFVACLGALLIQIPALVLSLSRGALVVFAVLAPLACAIAWARPREPGERARLPRVAAELAIVACVIALVVGIAGHGAWDELATLSRIDEGELSRRFANLRDALALLGLSPMLGIGRGAFVDLFPAAQQIPTHRLTTHLECAPAAMIVEWGPVVGVLLIAAVVAFGWRAWMRPDDDGDRPARRIALLGLLALALQSLADFSLEFVGVAAPAVALAGGLAAGPTWQWPRRTIGGAVGAVLLGAIALSIASAPRAAMGRTELAEDARSLLHALEERPLDGRVHGLLARRAAEAGDWAEAGRRAEIATRLRPGNIDAWLLRGAAAEAEGDTAAADVAIGRALTLVHALPSAELVSWLLERYPQPQRLALLGPDDRAAWRLLVDALAEASPRHADAFAAARGAAHPRDPEPLRVRHAMALREHNAALALHHARLLRQLAPADGSAHVAVAQALRTFDPPRLGEAQTALEHALESEVVEPLARAAVEQELVLVLLELGDAHALVRARVVVADLLTRPATRAERAFREQLAARARATEAGRW